MARQRTIYDLYQTGEEVVLEAGGDGEKPFVVWAQKLNDPDHEKASRRANAARALYVAETRDETSETHRSLTGELYDFQGGRGAMIELIVGPKKLELLQSVEAELSADDEWAKDDYLQGLRDLWVGSDANSAGGYREKFTATAGGDEQDTDVKRVFDELARFHTLCTVKVAEKTKGVVGEFDKMTDDEVREKAWEPLVRRTSTEVWLNEFYRSEIWLGVRDHVDHSKRVFATRDAVDDISDTVYDLLHALFESMRFTQSEGKGLRAVPSSSSSSGLPEQQETDDSSGPVAATA